MDKAQWHMDFGNDVWTKTCSGSHRDIHNTTSFTSTHWGTYLMLGSHTKLAVAQAVLVWAPCPVPEAWWVLRLNYWYLKWCLGRLVWSPNSPSSIYLFVCVCVWACVCLPARGEIKLWNHPIYCQSFIFTAECNEEYGVLRTDIVNVSHISIVLSVICVSH